MRKKKKNLRYPPNYHHGRPIADAADIARRRPTETVGISLISHSIAEIHCTSGLQSAILNSGSRPTSGNDKQRDKLFLTKSIHNIHELLKVVLLLEVVKSEYSRKRQSFKPSSRHPIMPPENGSRY